jgi:hypothetical protein
MTKRPPSRPTARATGVFALLATGLLAPAAGAEPPSAPPGAPSSEPPRSAAQSALRRSAALKGPLPEALEPITVDLGLQLGPAFRLGEGASFPVTERIGPALAIGAFITPSRRFSLGLEYEHVGLGREQGGDGEPDLVDVSRDLDALWAGLRLHLVSTPRAWLSALIGTGLVWQHAAASGVLSQGIGRPLLTIQCSGSAAANIAFRAGLGAEVVIGSGFSFLADVLFDNIRLGSGPLDDCVPGAGTMSLFSTRIGVAYQFDVSRFVR